MSVHTHESTGFTLDPTETNNVRRDLHDEEQPTKAHRPKQKQLARGKQSSQLLASSLQKATTNRRLLWVVLLVVVSLVILLAIVIAKFGRISSNTGEATSSPFVATSTSLPGPESDSMDKLSEALSTLNNDLNNNIFDHSHDHTSKPESSSYHPSLRPSSIPTTVPTSIPVSSASSSGLPNLDSDDSQTPDSTLAPSPPASDSNRRGTSDPIQSNATSFPTFSASSASPTAGPTTGSLTVSGIPEKQTLLSTSSPTPAETTTQSIVSPTMAPSARPSTLTTGSPTTATPTTPTTESPTTSSPTTMSWKGFTGFNRTELANEQTCQWEPNYDFFETQDLSDKRVIFETRHTITSPGLNVGSLNWMATYFTEGGEPYCGKVRYMKRGDSNTYVAECNSCGVAVIEVYAFNGKFSKTRDVAEVPTICNDDDESSSNSVPGRVCGWTITVPCLDSEGSIPSRVSGC